MEIRYIEVPLYLQMLLGICSTPRSIWKQYFKPIYFFRGGGGVGKHSVIWRGGAGEWKVRKYAGSMLTRHFEEATPDL